MEKPGPNSEQGKSAAGKDYLTMTDQEKDEEITRAIIRLQNKIRNILFHEDLRLSEQAPRNERVGTVHGEN